MKLLPFQERGVEFLCNTPQALLADFMGLGKTAQVLAALSKIQAKNILIICPALLKMVWQEQTKLFWPDCPLEFNLLGGGNETPLEGCINISSYSLVGVNEGVASKLRGITWDVVVLDEAHELRSRTTAKCKSLYGGINTKGVCHSSKRVWRLTATPMMNNIGDWYTHLRSAGKIEGMDYFAFLKRYAVGYHSDYGYQITGVKNEGQFKTLLDGFMLRRTLDDSKVELPPMTVETVKVKRSKVDLDPHFFEQCYVEGEENFLRGMEVMDNSIRLAMNTTQDKHSVDVDDRVKLIGSMNSSTQNLRKYIALAKLPACLDLIDRELASKKIDKIILFATHKAVIEETMRKLSKYDPVAIYGPVTPKLRQKAVERFQKDGLCRVFVGNIDVAGPGITLTSAAHVAFLEASWVPSVNAQAMARAHRIGQTRPVNVRFFCCEGSVDEKVMEVVARKSYQISKIIY